MNGLTVEEFFRQRGMKFETTTLLSVVEGKMRMPDLNALFHEYAQLKLQEFLKKESALKSGFDANNPFVTVYHEDDICG